MSVEIVVEKKVFPASPHPTTTWVLSMNDCVMPPVNIRWIAFYDKDDANSGNLDEFMSPAKLEASLAKTLDLYPLLAGRLVRLPLGKLQIEYSQDNLVGCSFVVAKADFTLESIRKSHFARKAVPDALKPGTAMPTSGAPLFAAQITRLACGSVAMSYSLHHNVGDGFSVQTFIEKWSRVCRGLSVESPLLDRSALKPTSDPLVDDHNEYKVMDPNAPAPTLPSGPRPESVLLVLNFDAEKVARLKSAANTGLDAGRWVSTNDCVVTLVWRALTRARGLKAGDTTVCGIAVDGRKKWNTPLGDMSQYFGNFITFPKVSADAGTLLSYSLGSASLLLRDQVEKMDTARLQSSLNFIDRIQDISTIQGNFSFFQGNDIFVSNWVTFPMYDCDFGWGKATKAMLHAPGTDGISLMLPRGPAKDADKNGIEVVLGVVADNADKVIHDTELTQFASIVVD